MVGRRPRSRLAAGAKMLALSCIIGSTTWETCHAVYRDGTVDICRTRSTRSARSARGTRVYPGGAAPSRGAGARRHAVRGGDDPNGAACRRHDDGRAICWPGGCLRYRHRAGADDPDARAGRTSTGNSGRPTQVGCPCRRPVRDHPRHAGSQAPRNARGQRGKACGNPEDGERTAPRRGGEADERELQPGDRPVHRGAEGDGRCAGGYRADRRHQAAVLQREDARRLGRDSGARDAGRHPAAR